VPRGFIAAADVVVLVLLVGGAWVVVDRIGTLPVIVDALVVRFGHRGLWVVPCVSLFFGTMGALENMQEEIIPLVPVLLLLGNGLGVDAITVVAMSAGAAMVGSAFGPTNPFQAGIALKIAQLPPLERGGLRFAMLAAGLGAWIVLTLRHAVRAQSGKQGAESTTAKAVDGHAARGPIERRHVLVMLIMAAPMAAYVYGALRLDWELNQLSAGFVIAAIAAGLIGRLGLAGTITTYLDGMATVLPAAMLIGLARSISLVLDDGRVVDTILNGMVTPLAHLPAMTAALLMIPFHALLHIAVPSVSGHAVLTMPLFAPVADLLGFSREAAVLAYQTGAGLMEMVTPTNGALMAVLLAAHVPWGRWIRFAWIGIAALMLIGIAAIAVVMFA
jgi:uncharacterized ion transporter superfamily protein YfcC